MKWLAVFSAIVGGNTATIDDLDGPTEFNTYRACVLHSIEVAPKLERILQAYLPNEKNIHITWKCEFGIAQ